MSDLIEVLYRLRDMAGMAADKLRVEVQAGQAVLDKLDKFADECEEGAELLAASDLHPGMHANIPERSGLTRVTTEPMAIPCRYCADSPCTCPVAAEPEEAKEPACATTVPTADTTTTSAAPPPHTTP
jgi:hypothetical protein